MTNQNSAGGEKKLGPEIIVSLCRNHGHGIEYLTLNDWSRGEQWIFFPENLNVSRDKCHVTIKQPMNRRAVAGKKRQIYNDNLFLFLFSVLGKEITELGQQETKQETKV